MFNKPGLIKFDHIGVAVKDIAKAVEFYQTLGVGPFNKSSIVTKDKTLHGKPITGGITLVQIGRMGNIGLQLIQPVEGDSISKESLENIGECINHVAFEVDDIESIMEDMVNKGYAIVFSSKYVGGGGEIYIDTGNNFYIQYFQVSPVP